MYVVQSINFKVHMGGNRVIRLLDVLLTLKIRDLKYYLKKKTGIFMHTLFYRCILFKACFIVCYIINNCTQSFDIKK